MVTGARDAALCKVYLVVLDILSNKSGIGCKNLDKIRKFRPGNALARRPILVVELANAGAF